METRANYVWVGAITLLLLAALAAFIVWIVGLGTADRKQYDIFFPQAVEGLAEGSQVTFSGVPVGKVDEMNLWERDPQFVQVRISVEEEVPILRGTTATVLGSFTGVSTIQLDGARAGQPPITRPGRDGVPEIQPKAGGLGAILSSAPQLLENLSNLTERLTEVLSPRNQRSIEGILANTDRLTGELADASPRVEGVLTELEATLAQATETLDAFEQTLGTTDQLLNEEGASIAQELRQTLASTRRASASIEAAMSDVRPAAREFSESTLPAAEAALRDLRRTTTSLREVTESIQQSGAGGLIGGKALPDYEPCGDRDCRAGSGKPEGSRPLRRPWRSRAASASARSRRTSCSISRRPARLRRAPLRAATSMRRSRSSTCRRRRSSTSPASR